MHLTLIGAYGRDYKSKEAVLADWNAGKDFYIMTPGHPSYISIRDARKYGVALVTFRYKGSKESFISNVEAL